MLITSLYLEKNPNNLIKLIIFNLEHILAASVEDFFTIIKHTVIS